MHIWPDDFVSVDAGRLSIRRDVVPMFDRRGWTRVEAIVLAPQFHYARSRPYFGGWDTGTGELRDGDTDKVLRCHIKRFRRGFRGRSVAFREADKVRLFQSAGIPCLDLVAVGRLAMGGPNHPFRSCLITERVGEAESLAERLAATSKQNSATDLQRRALFDVAARKIARMHAADIYHGDCKLLHLMLESGKADETSCRFIDLERARRVRGPAAVYAWIKDLDQCERSLRVIGATPDEIAHWCETYDRAYLAAGGALAAWRDLRHRALHVRREFNRIRKPLVRAVQWQRRRTVRVGKHPLHAAKLRYRATLADQ